MAHTHMYDQDAEQQQMQEDRIGMMRGQLNHEFRGRDNLDEGLASWRRGGHAHTVPGAIRREFYRGVNFPIPPPTQSSIPTTQSGPSRSEYIALMERAELSDDQLNQLMDERGLPYGPKATMEYKMHIIYEHDTDKRVASFVKQSQD